MSTVLSLVGLVAAQCPYGIERQPQKREPSNPQTSSSTFLDQFTINDTNTYFTTDAGGPIQEDTSLKAGVRGPTLLEDFIFRQKIQHFDHERVGVYFFIINGSTNLFKRYQNVPFTPEVPVSTASYFLVDHY